MTAHILVVDDILPNQKLLDARLSSEGYEVITSSSGQDAIEKARAKKPDLILLDMKMPVMNGFEVCKAMKADPLISDIPVVMMTALTDSEEILSAIRIGAEDVFAKPLDDTSMMERIRVLLEKSSFRAIRNRQLLILKIDLLLAALKENLSATDGKQNISPSFDLALHDDKNFADQVRKLTDVLSDTKNVLEKSASINRTKESLAEAALKEFITKLSGSVGEGLGKTITWGARLALATFAIDILKNLGVPVDGLISLINSHLPKI